jgi:hypothetical protein
MTATIRGSAATRAACSASASPGEDIALVPRGKSASVTVGTEALSVEVTRRGQVVGRPAADASPGTTLRLRW